MASSLSRLAVNGLGFVTVLAGLAEAWRLVIRRPYVRPSSQP